MKVSKIAAANARRLFGLCMADSRLDETKLRQVIQSLVTSQPRDYRAILVALQRLVRLDADKRKVLVESATPLDESTKARVAAGLAKDHGPDLLIDYRTTPELLGGLRIQVGDDVLDGSVQGRLDRLAQIF
jgi:F-type H+-transporting ATPase subunit delta